MPWNKGKPRTPEERARISASLKGRKHTPEARAKIAEAARRRYQDPEERAKLLDQVARMNEGHGARLARLWRDPDFCERHRQRSRDRMRRRHAEDPSFTDRGKRNLRQYRDRAPEAA